MPTPKFGLAKSAAEARKIAEDIGTNDLVVKAQVKLALFDLSLTFAFSRFLLEVVEEGTLSTIPRAAYNLCTALRRWKIFSLPFFMAVFHGCFSWPICSSIVLDFFLFTFLLTRWRSALRAWSATS